MKNRSIKPEKMDRTTKVYTDADSGLYKPLRDKKDLDPLIERIGNAKYVLLGEATHGTHEYYLWRAEISKRLIKEKGFSFIAVEGDWPDCNKINHWIKGYGDSHSNIIDVLKQFRRWPTWMWANWEVAALANWLRDYNQTQKLQQKIGFYGLDVYSLWESMEIIYNYLKEEDPIAAQYAKEAINCFEPYGEDFSYTSALRSLEPDCMSEVIQLLQEVQKRSKLYDSQLEAGLNAEINALVTANAEKYYRTMASFGDSSWNIRDQHMVESLNSIMNFHGTDAKVIVWEHNTHIGDARATNMAASGLLNVGQLVREQHKEEDVVLVGFGSYKGSVIAGRMWEASMQKMDMPKAKAGSVEEILHSASPENKLLIFNESKALTERFNKWLGHRAIGVVYNPERDRGNYVSTKLSSRYDAFMYIDHTNALHPLHIKPAGNLTPETFPFGI